MGETDIQEFVDAVDAVMQEQLPRWKSEGSLSPHDQPRVVAQDKRA
jgi:hypothetical protein